MANVERKRRTRWAAWRELDVREERKRWRELDVKEERKNEKVWANKRERGTNENEREKLGGRGQKKLNLFL